MWPEIPLFHNVKKYVSQFPEVLKGNTKISYKAKVKLHGVNAGILFHFKNDTVTAQSRTQLLSEKNDNKCFAKWLKENEKDWLEVLKKYKDLYAAATGMVVWGEWVGPGIMSGVAVSNIPEKSFVIFSAEVFFSDTDSSEKSIFFIFPNMLSLFKKHSNGVCKNTYVLPWHDDLGDIEIDFADEKSLQLSLDKINHAVENIEKCDPWVKSVFGIEGIGEGLVFYPMTFCDSKEDIENFIFKAKGKKHETVQTNKPAQMSAEKASSAEDFANLVLTEARLMQGMLAISENQVEITKAKISPFLKWIEKDVQKECQDELQASNLTWNDVSKCISDKSRKWFFTKMGW